MFIHGYSTASTDNSYFILLLFPAKELCSSKCTIFCKANQPESWMASSCRFNLKSTKKIYKRYSECKANNYPDRFPISAMDCSCICSWAANGFLLSHGERKTQIPEFHCLEESPQQTHLGVNGILCWKQAWTYSCCSWTQLARTIYIAWKPGKRV